MSRGNESSDRQVVDLNTPPRADRDVLAAHPAPGHPRSPSCSKRSCGQEPLPTGDASTSASEPQSADMEALAKALLTRHPDGYPSPLQSDYHRRLVARALLASDWLAAREAKARAEAGEQALREAAEDLNREGLSFKPGGWGSNPADQQTIDVLVKAVQWLRDRAARIAREVTS